jgi:hypothetical protein
MRIKKLKWGQTPFDKMTKKKLLLVAKTMYSALISARSALAILDYPKGNPYFGERGSGGRALEKAEQAYQLATSGHDSENVYRSFFRYADDLLFDCSVFEIGSNWYVCDKCKTMIGIRNNSDKTCICGNEMRKMTWDDLKP